MTFDEILEKIRDLGTTQSQRDKGTAFENLTLKFLQTDKKYASRFNLVMPFGKAEITDGSNDIGIDLIAKIDNDKDEWVAIQCKCYDDNYRVQKSDIDSFLSASSKYYSSQKYGKIEFIERYLVYIAKDLSSNVERTLENQTPPLVQITYQDFLNSTIDWDSFDFTESYNLKNKSFKKLRPHQEEAITNIKKEFQQNNRAKLIMACGTGKTLTAIRLMDDVLKDNQIGIFLAPSISLVSQTMMNFFEQSNKDFKGFVVCSDTKVGKNNEDIRVIDLPYPPTTNAQKLSYHIENCIKNNNRVIIFGTYQSIDVVAEALKSIDKSAEIIICDEAHRTAGVSLETKEDSHFVKVHNDDFIKSNYRLYMTATPKIYSENIKNNTEQNEILLYSMDDEKIFGKTAYSLMFDKALEYDLLSDYKVIIATIDQRQILDLANKTPTLEYKDENNKTISINIDIEFLGQILAVYKSLKKQDITILDSTGKETPLDEDLEPMKRSIAFNSSINNSKNRTYLFEKIIKTYDPSNYNCELDHIDGAMNSTIKSEKLKWLSSDDKDSLKILSNARCLTEGIDISNLDSVIFYDARDSIVDIVQAVGRVMRKSKEKKYGYVILPVVMNLENISNYDNYISQSKEFKSVWKVLKALRSHDPRLVSEAHIVDKIKIANIKIKDFSLNQSDIDTNKDIDNIKGAIYQPGLFDLLNFSNSVKNIIPEKIGDRMYWSSFARNVADISKTIEQRLKELLEINDGVKMTFDVFIDTLRKDINDNIDENDALDMLTQHIITKPIFDAIYGENSFGKNNPISISMQEVYENIKLFGLDNETKDLNLLYQSIEDTAKRAITDKEKQNIIKNLYDTFFRSAYKKDSERLGVVYTPIEVVDFIIHSVNYALKKHFNNKTLDDKNINILDPFTGTGTFITRLLQSDIINNNLDYKYDNEIFANEITLIAYYIANLNIASVYHSIKDEYKELKNICFTDTFAMEERDNILDETNTKSNNEIFVENTKRIKHQKDSNINIIISNPPYSASQRSVNDNNKNVSYEHLNNKIKETYVAHSDQTLVKNLYDSYIQAIRYATDRIKDNGIIGYVTNGSFIDSNNMSGLRYSLEKEFSYVYIVNLRGNQRTSGEESRKEGGKIFGSGSRAPVAITILIKDKNYKKDKAEIYYYDIGDYLTTDDKLSKLQNFKSIENLYFTPIKPNKYNDWINQRDDSFNEFYLIGNKNKKIKEKTIFKPIYSLGIATNRDTWCINFSKKNLSENMQNSINFYNNERIKLAKNGSYKLDMSKSKISWSVKLLNLAHKNIEIKFDKSKIRKIHYRPFNKQYIYYDFNLNERQNQMDKLYPFDATQEFENLSIQIVGIGANKDFSVIMSNCIADIQNVSNGQIFPLYYYEENKQNIAQEDTLFSEEQNQDTNSSKYIKKDAIRDEALKDFREIYKDESIGKIDIFYYIYGLLHSEEYKERFKDNLSKQLPRIPYAKDFWTFRKIGYELAQIHLNYETIDITHKAKAVKLNYKDGNLFNNEEGSIDNLDDECFKVNKMRFNKVSNKTDKSVLIYNNHIKIINIPKEAHNYVVNGKSAIEWLIDRYRKIPNKDSGIINDPNLYSDNPRYIIDLILRVIEVSVRSVELINKLPKIDEQ